MGTTFRISGEAAYQASDGPYHIHGALFAFQVIFRIFKNCDLFTHICREVTTDTVGSKIIFTTMGDAKVQSPFGCWSYVGKVGNVGGENGQSINLGSPVCYNFGYILHEVMHSLGKK